MLFRSSNRIEPSQITHRPLDGHHRVREEDEFIFQYEPTEDEAEQEAEDLRSISPDSWGEDIDWDDADVDEDSDDDDGEDPFIYEAINDDRQ